MSLDTNAGNSADAEGLQPLEGEPGIPSVNGPKRSAVSAKAVTAGVIAVLAFGATIYASVVRLTKSEAPAQQVEDRKAPKAAVTLSPGRTFDPTRPPRLPGEQPPPPIVPAIVPGNGEAGEAADPIGIRGEQEAPNGKARRAPRSPYDGGAMVGLLSTTDTRGASAEDFAEDSREGVADTAGTGSAELQERKAALTKTKQSLNDYQGQMRSMMTALQDKIGGGGATAAAGAMTDGVGTIRQGVQALGNAPLGGQLATSGTARVAAGHLGDRSLTLPKGTMFTCALKTEIVSEQAGFVACQVLRNVYSDDNRVLLVERGSHMDGEYSAKIKNGQSRIFVIWSRLRTPQGVTVDIASPATGALGEAGVEGYVDNHWKERVGAALLLSLVEDSMKIAAARAGAKNSTSVVLDGQADTSASLAERVLDNTINIAPTIYKLRGEVVGIYVSRDVDFSSVYELRTASR